MKKTDVFCCIFWPTLIVCMAVGVAALILGLTLGFIREEPFTNSTLLDVNSTSSVASVP